MGYLFNVMNRAQIAFRDAWLDVSYSRNQKKRIPSDIRPVKLQSMSDRREYSPEIRLWDDRDPRSEQSFFQSGLPSFVLSADQKIIDWNAGFELVFSELESLKRGMNVSNWYKHIDNFKRIPNREQKLFGEAVLPITDRERVVYLSGVYGRIVFTKIMSPILERVSGRVIGWNIVLNVNSVHERVKFFEDLFKRIESDSHQSRYAAGLYQLCIGSPSFVSWTKELAEQLDECTNVLIVGANRSEILIGQLLEDGLHRTVTIVDDNVATLRHIKSLYSRFSHRLKIIRRSPHNIDSLPAGRYDALVGSFLSMKSENMQKLGRIGVSSGIDDRKVLFTGFTSENSRKDWWNNLKVELESLRKFDLIKWHFGLTQQIDLSLNSQAIQPSGSFVFGIDQTIDLSHCLSWTSYEKVKSAS
ncbi:MAG: hypothetical protein NT027_00755 [Proteobacteria bacterium]|nr:hypothetical protein [Pseudomonadota bacterium]